MGFLDDAKKLSKLVDGHEDEIKAGIDKAADLAESKLGADKADTVDSVAKKAKGLVDGLGT